MKKHIPSIFTVINLICGFVALLLGDFLWSAWLIFAGMILDVLDGMTARVMNAQSEIGKELDSMADLVTFGVAPSYLYFLLAPGDSWFYYIPPVILLIGGALRLAIFNTLPSSKIFLGLPTPANAFFMFGIFVSFNYDIEFVNAFISNNYGYFFIPIFLSFMMLSRLEMFSLKNITKPYLSNVYHILALAFFVIALIIIPPVAPLIATSSYIILSFIWNLTKTRQIEN